MAPAPDFRPVLQLFPAPGGPVPLRGLYLDDDIRPRGTPQRPFVYASFIASLDGRISLPDRKSGRLKPPPETTNPRDWRLLQEVAASADVLLTSGRYLRDLAAGEAQAELPVSHEPAFADLRQWRREQGLDDQPAAVIVSHSLDLPIPQSLHGSGRRLYVATGTRPDEGRVRALEAQGLRVLRCGNADGVAGRALIEALAGEGFGNIALVAGAVLMDTLVADGMLHRLYLTQACRLLGGSHFDTLLTGERLLPPPEFRLRALYHDAAGPTGIEQLFSVLDACAPA